MKILFKLYNKNAFRSGEKLPSLLGCVDKKDATLFCLQIEDFAP